MKKFISILIMASGLILMISCHDEGPLKEGEVRKVVSDGYIIKIDSCIVFIDAGDPEHNTIFNLKKGTMIK